MKAPSDEANTDCAEVGSLSCSTDLRVAMESGPHDAAVCHINEEELLLDEVEKLLASEPREDCGLKLLYQAELIWSGSNCATALQLHFAPELPLATLAHGKYFLLLNLMAGSSLQYV